MDTREIKVAVTQASTGLVYEFQPVETCVPPGFDGEIRVVFADDMRGCRFGDDGRLSKQVKTPPRRATPVMIRIPWQNPHPEEISCVEFDVKVVDKGGKPIGHRHHEQPMVTSHEAVIRNEPPS